MTQAKTVEIVDGGVPRRFRIVPMSGVDAEDWILRAMFAVGQSAVFTGKEFKPSDIIRMVMATDFRLAKPLLDDLLRGVKLIGADETMTPVLDASVKNTIQSPTTLLQLRVESLKLNFGFLLNGDALSFLSISGTAQSAQK